MDSAANVQPQLAPTSVSRRIAFAALLEVLLVAHAGFQTVVSSGSGYVLSSARVLVHGALALCLMLRLPSAPSLVWIGSVASILIQSVEMQDDSPEPSWLLIGVGLLVQVAAPLRLVGRTMDGIFHLPSRVFSPTAFTARTRSIAVLASLAIHLAIHLVFQFAVLSHEGWSSPALAAVIGFHGLVAVWVVLRRYGAIPLAILGVLLDAFLLLLCRIPVGLALVEISLIAVRLFFVL